MKARERVQECVLLAKGSARDHRAKDQNKSLNLNPETLKQEPKP